MNSSSQTPPPENENVFVTPTGTESNLFADEPVICPTPELSKKPIRKQIILFAAAGVLLAGALVAAPLGLKSAGDKQLSTGNYQTASHYYKWCLGAYGTKQRRAITDAVATMAGGNIDAGVASLLETGIPVDLHYDLCGGEFVNTSRKSAVSLTKPEEFGSLYKAMKEYYDFAGWDLAAYRYAPEFEGSVFRVDLTAVYSPTKYKISYANLFSDTVENPQEYTVEDKTITLKAPSRAGYTFVAWTGSELTGEAATVVIPQGSRGDRAYAAKWQPNDYVVTLEPDVQCNIISPITITYGTAYSLPNLKKRGYTHTGWSDGRNTCHSGIWDIPQDTKLSPVWMLEDYTLSYDLAGGTLSGANPSSYTVISEDISLKEPTRFGYSFQGWSCNGAAARKDVVIKKDTIGDMNFKAVWKGNPHTLTLDPAGGWIESPTINVAYGSEFYVPTPYREGYTFQGWYVGETKLNDGAWNQDKDVSAIARWTANKYDLPLNANGGDIASSSVTVTYGESYHLPSPTRADHTFLGWYNGDKRIDDSGTWNIDSSVALTACWKQTTFTVFLHFEGRETETVKVTYGSQYLLPMYLSHDVAGDIICLWFSDSSKSYSDYFPYSGVWDKEYDVHLNAVWFWGTFVSLFADNGTPVVTIPIRFGEKYELPTPERPGYTFCGWYYNETFVWRNPSTGKEKEYDNYSKINTSGTWRITNAEINLIAKWQ